MPKEEELINFSVRINKKIAEDWYATVIKNSQHPVRDRLEEALKENLERHKKNG